MRGEIEIYEGDKLLYSEPNMLVDGAGALLADIMTVSPSLSGIADTATSSILDSSNYTIQAISFGTSKLGLMGNAQYMDTSTNPTTGAQDPAYKWAGIWKDNAAGGKPVGNIKTSGPTALVYSPDMARAPYDTSTYVPLVGLPTPPEPSLSALEMTGYHEGQGVNATVSALVGGFPTEDMPTGGLNLLEPTPLSSLFSGPGQLVNTMPSAISEHIFQNTAFSANSVPLGNQRYFLPSCFLGAFPQGSSTECADLPRGTETRGGTRVLIFPSHDWSLQLNEADATYDFTYSGIFNEASSMDASGFVTMVMSATPQDAATTPGADYTYEISSTYSGLCLSGSDDLSSNGTIEYSVTIGSGDAGMANLYGGIYHLGLWTIDINKSLREGNSAPFAFNVLDNPRKYRLFARKGLSKNLCYIQDGRGAACEPPCHGAFNYSDITIKWRIHFL